MLERFSDQARRAVAMAQQEARRLGHNRVGTEHLLLGLLADPDSPTAVALTNAGASLDAARQKVAEAVPRDTEQPAPHGRVTLTPRAKRALERASRFSLQRRDREVETTHVLLGVLDVEGTAGQVLRGVGVDITSLTHAADIAVEVHSHAAIVDPPERRDAPPRCAVCGSPLDAALACRVVGARIEPRESRPFLVAYCAVCGSTIGATPV
jgi:ATP-dependent Clp protease ATP-binding subunit ClpC